MNEQGVGALLVGLVVAGWVGACGSDDPTHSGTPHDGGRAGGTNQAGSPTGGAGQGGDPTGGTAQGGSTAGGTNQGGVQAGGTPGGGSGAGGSAGSNSGGSGAGAGGVAGVAGSSGYGGSNGGAGGVEEPELRLLDCSRRDPTGATVVSAAITSDQTWSGVIHLDGVVSVSNATLTIEAGTNIVAAEDSHLEIADNGSIVAEGTLRSPIYFCGATEERGYWNGLTIRQNAANDSQLHNLLVADAGSDTEAILLETSVEVDNLQSRNSGADGIRAADFAAGSQHLSIEGASSRAAVLTTADAATHFPLGGFLTNNGDNTVHLAFAEIATDVTLHDATLPYVQDETIEVTAGSLTLDAGIEYRVATGSRLRIGGSGDPALFVNGTASAPIRIRGVVEQSGDWDAIVFLPTSDPNSRLAHVDISHAGSDNGFALLVGAAVTLDHVRISNSAGGALVQSQGLASGSTHLTVTSCTGYPIAAYPNALVTLPTGGELTGNGGTVIRVDTSTFTTTGTVPNLGIPYEFRDGLETMAGSHLTIAPGTSFLFPSGDMKVGANSATATITAVGTESDPIVISSQSGTWPGITIGPNVTSGSTFDYVKLLNGDPACLTLHTPISVTHSTFNNCEWGILKMELDTTDYVDTNAFISMGQGGVGNWD